MFVILKFYASKLQWYMIRKEEFQGKSSLNNSVLVHSKVSRISHLFQTNFFAEKWQKWTFLKKKIGFKTFFFIKYVYCWVRQSWQLPYYHSQFLIKIITFFFMIWKSSLESRWGFALNCPAGDNNLSPYCWPVKGVSNA